MADEPTVTAEEIEAVAKQTAESPDEVEAQPGGIVGPEGYEHVGTIEAHHEDGENRIVLSDLKPNVKVDIQGTGVSAALDKPFAHAPEAVLRGRILHDSSGRAYVYRKDEGDITYLYVSRMGHYASPEQG